MEHISPQELSDSIVSFLNRFSYLDDARLPRDEFDDIYNHAITFLPGEEKIVHALSEYVFATFSFLPREIKKAVAVYDSYQMSIDDIAVEEHDSLDGLCVQLSTQERISHPLWKGFYASFPDLLKYYGPYGQATLFRGAMEFIQATALERTLFRGYPSSKYPDYVRRMSAQGPVQAVICFPASDFPEEKYLPIIASMEAELEDFVGTVNDVFSFYKESRTALDRINYPLNRWACSGRRPLQVIYDLIQVSIDCRDRIYSILHSSGHQHIWPRMDSFLTGYVRYHLACDRYKIRSLCVESDNKTLIAYYNMSLRAVGRPPSVALKTGFWHLHWMSYFTSGPAKHISLPIRLVFCFFSIVIFILRSCTLF